MAAMFLDQQFDEKMFRVALWTLIVTVVAGILALLGVWIAVKALRDTGKIAKEQFLVSIRSLFANYDDVHARFRPGGEWAPASHSGPAEAHEWTRVELYMGTFEHCERLIQQRLLNEVEFRESFEYRLRNIVANTIVVQVKLVHCGEH